MDCNNFFVSCERLFRPELIKKPVFVLSSNDGCVVARSQEVKDLGIPMGVPYFEVKDLCEKHKITVFSSNFTLYRDISSRVMSALKDEFESIDIYSIDEAFFEISNPDPDEVMRMRERIMKKTGIPVSFGIAASKTLAKIANAEAKRSKGVSILTNERAIEIGDQISCGSVWGIGRQTSSKLTAFKIHTIKDLREAGLNFMRQNFGVLGERLYFELSGIPASSSELDGSIPHSIASTRSFGEIVHDKETLKSALAHHIILIGEKLRIQEIAASTLTIICAPSRHGDYALRKGSVHRSLVLPTNDTQLLLKEAYEMLDSLYSSEIPYKKAGVIASGIVPESCISSSLFEPTSREKSKALYAVIDGLNNKFGKGTVSPALVHGGEGWREAKKNKSPEYTTSWTHIPNVKAI